MPRSSAADAARTAERIRDCALNLFAEHGINIAAQTLITKGEIGYLVMDVAHSDSQVALEQLKSVAGTIRSRIIY